jgi:hypothetical protein
MMTCLEWRITSGASALLCVLCLAACDAQRTAAAESGQCLSLTPNDNEFWHRFVFLKPEDRGKARRLVRADPSGPIEMIGIHSTPSTSASWVTSCPVYLYEPSQREAVSTAVSSSDESNASCLHQRVFSDDSTLVIRRGIFGGLRFEVQDTEWGVLSGKLSKKAYRPGANEVTWLMSKAVKGTKLPPGMKADVYIYLQDTSGSDVLGRPANYKAYWIEVFDQTDKACDSHRPELAICSDADLRVGCGADYRPAPITGKVARETDTGGGHEPPVDDK